MKSYKDKAMQGHEPWDSTPTFEGAPDASPGAIIDYLRAVIKSKDAEISDLTLRLKTMRMSRQLEENEIEKKIEALALAQETVEEYKKKLKNTPPLIIHERTKKWRWPWRKNVSKTGNGISEESFGRP